MKVVRVLVSVIKVMLLLDSGAINTSLGLWHIQMRLDQYTHSIIECSAKKYFLFLCNENEYVLIMNNMLWNMIIIIAKSYHVQNTKYLSIHFLWQKCLIHIWSEWFGISSLIKSCIIFLEIYVRFDKISLQGTGNCSCCHYFFVINFINH